jgi:DNA-directed RNA polymerase specialized sigma24 family protein
MKPNEEYWKTMNHMSKQRAALYATSSDFCRIFREDMERLYWVALVLTTDPDKAEQCFVSGLNDCSEGNLVFKEWARSWAKRVVIKNAIRMVSPVTAQAIQEQGVNVLEVSNHFNLQAADRLPAEVSALLGLPDLERFAYVMSLCEGYSDHDCALLLGCTRSQVSAARIRAVQRIGRVLALSEQAGAAGSIAQVNNRLNEFSEAALLATPA